jgi:hyaluronan synthase
MNTYTNKKEYPFAFSFLNKEQFDVARNFPYQIFLSVALVTVLCVGVWLKYRTFGEYTGDWFLIGYTFVLTLFQLFRLTSALFFKKSLASVINSLPIQLRNSIYEPKVTCVIPCKNEEKAIRTTISKCFEADYPREKLEVVVIDDGSTDKTGEILDELKSTKYPDLNIIHWKKNRGKREGMNAGFQMGTGDIFIQLDSDSYIIPETFRKIVEPFKNPSIGAVCAHADPENADFNWMSKMQAAYYFMAFRILKAAESTFGMVFCCSGCSSAYRREAVMPILSTWLAESFLGQKVTWGDDRALTSYVIKNGYKTIYTDEAKAVTIVPTTFRQLIKQQVRWKKSWIINAFFTGKFIWKTDPFVAFSYYYPLIIISILTPIMAARALFYTPIFVNYTSLGFYVLGGIVITSLLVIFCKFVNYSFKYWPYLFLWSIFNIFILSFLLFYAATTIQNRSWGTR